MFCFHVARGAQRDEVVELVGFFPIAVKLVVGAFVMNTQFLTQTGFGDTAILASIIITLTGFAALLLPVWASIMIRVAAPTPTLLAAFREALLTLPLFTAECAISPKAVTHLGDIRARFTRLSDADLPAVFFTTKNAVLPKLGSLLTFQFGKLWRRCSEAAAIILAAPRNIEPLEPAVNRCRVLVKLLSDGVKGKFIFPIQFNKLIAGDIA